MIVSFHPCIDADLQILLGDRLPNKEELRYINNAEAIILPQGCSKELFKVCLSSKASIFPDYKCRFEYSGKIKQIILFKNINMPYPCSICWDNIEKFYKIRTKFADKTPFLIKENNKHEGKGIHIVKHIDDIKGTYNALKQSDGIIAQELINCNGDVLRVVIIGDMLFSYWKRAYNPEQVIVTVNDSAYIDYKWAPHLQEKGKELVKILIHKTGINLAAVDIVFKDKTTPLLLEINYYFGRKGLGGTEKYYKLLVAAIKKWLNCQHLDSNKIKLSY